MIEHQYLYSRLTPDSVSELIASHYNIAAIHSCVFYVLGLHDNYLIQTDTEKFFVRIYRNDWRTAEEIQFELELLSYLHDKQQPVSSPISTHQNELSLEIECPEGKRSIAVFDYAAGEPLTDKIAEHEAQLLGRCVANIHNQTEGFHSTAKRQMLDLSLLVDRSLNVIEPFLTEAQKCYLSSVQEVLVANLAALTKDESKVVVCIGDVNPTNFHLTDDNKINLFDFDQCGYGQRAFEIGKFFSSVYYHPSSSEVKRAFLQAYESVHTLSAVERKAIPYFEVASVIWVMSIRVDNVNKVGHIALDAAYWCRRIAIIEALMNV